MKKSALWSMTDDQLVDRFAELALQQHDPLRFAEAGPYNAIVKEIRPIQEELQRRGASSFTRLDRLLTHPNITVRLEAARRLVTVMPDKTRLVLQQMITAGRFPWADDAGMLLDLSMRQADSAIAIPQPKT